MYTYIDGGGVVATLDVVHHLRVHVLLGDFQSGLSVGALFLKTKESFTFLSVGGVASRDWLDLLCDTNSYRTLVL